MEHTISTLKEQTIDKLRRLLAVVEADQLDSTNLQNLHSLLHGKPVGQTNLQDQGSDFDWDQSSYPIYEAAVPKGATR